MTIEYFIAKERYHAAMHIWWMENIHYSNSHWKTFTSFGRIFLYVHMRWGLLYMTIYEMKHGIYGIQLWICLHNRPQKINSISWICRNRHKWIYEHFLKLFVYPGSCSVPVLYHVWLEKVYVETRTEKTRTTIIPFRFQMLKVEFSSFSTAQNFPKCTLKQ